MYIHIYIYIYVYVYYGFGDVGEAYKLRWGCVLPLGPALLDAGWSPTLFLEWFGGTSAVQTTVVHQIYLIGVVSA